MAEATGGSNVPKKPSWQKVKATYKALGGASRRAPEVTVSEHGGVETNVGATSLLDATAVARGMDPTKEYNIDLANDDERGIIVVYATNEVSEGTTTIRRYKKGASHKLTFHIGAAFLESPGLRPEYKKVKCLVHHEYDENGLPVLAIPIKAGKAKITQSRSDDGTPGSQAAAGEETPEE